MNYLQSEMQNQPEFRAEPITNVPRLKQSLCNVFTNDYLNATFCATKPFKAAAPGPWEGSFSLAGPCFWLHPRCRAENCELMHAAPAVASHLRMTDSICRGPGRGALSPHSDAYTFIIPPCHPIFLLLLSIYRAVKKFSDPFTSFTFC